MLPHILPDAGLKRLDDFAAARAQLFVVLFGHQAVTPDALPPIVAEELRAKRFRHGAFGAAVVFQQFFQAVLGLRVARSEGRAGGVRGEDVRHAVFIAQDGDVRGVGERAGSTAAGRAFS